MGSAFCPVISQFGKTWTRLILLLCRNLDRRFLSTQLSENVVTAVFCADSLSRGCKSSAKADVQPWFKQHCVAKQGLVHESFLFEGTRVLSAVQIDELEAVRNVEMI